MSDELETLAKGGGIATALLGLLAGVWRWVARRTERLEKRLERQTERELEALKGEVRQLRAELAAALVHPEKALAAQRSEIEHLKRVCVELDTRVGFREGRYGVEPLTNPGMRPSAAVKALREQESDDV